MKAGVSFVLIALAACTGRTDRDVPEGNAQTQGGAIRDVSDPSVESRPGPNATVTVSNVQVLAVDTYDETNNGRSRGTIYVKDYGSDTPWSGIGLFSPVFLPADLRVAPGDVLDMTGTYQENANIGTARFPEGQVLPQLSRPVSIFQFESKTPAPVVVPAKDLATYAGGRKWIGSLVTIKNVKLSAAFSSDPAGRVTGTVASDDGSAFQVTNELTPIVPDRISVETRLATVTGIVTYFFNLHVAPRSEADIVVE